MRTSMLNELSQDIWDTCEEKGFHQPIDAEMAERGVRLALIHSEVSEALEDLRKGNVEDSNREVVDVLIRALHYLRIEGIDIDTEILDKMDKNRGRPYSHGKRF